jgi:rhamnosyl/mannosyltransferase
VKHILIIGKYYPPALGGIERYTADTARAVSMSHRVTVLVHNTESFDQIEHIENVTIIRCGTSFVVSSQPISLSMLGYIRSLQPDLIHFNAPNFWAAGMLLLARPAAPLILTHHADVFGRAALRRALIPSYHRLVNRAKCIVVNCLSNASASRDLPANSGPIVEVPWGVDPAGYQLGDTDRIDLIAERRRRYGDLPVIGFVGRFVRYKGISVLIKAVSRIDGAQLLLIGDGPLRSALAAQVQELGLRQRVHFLGHLDEVAKIQTMAMMDFLILPSTDTTETFGLVQVEAHMMGMPVIASNLATGVRDVNPDNVTGLLVPPGDHDALAAAIVRLIHDKPLAERLGQNARDRAHRLFPVKAFEERIAKVFDTVLAGEPLGDLTLSVLRPQSNNSIGS